MSRKQKHYGKEKWTVPIRKLNMNTIVKVKLTERGIDIFFHQYDSLIDRGVEIVRMYPNIDEGGFTSFRLWVFMSLYGPYIGNGLPNVVEDICFYIPDDEMDYIEGWPQKKNNEY